MHTPVNQHTAARNGLGGERTAQTGNASERTEGNINMIDIAEYKIGLSSLNVVF